MNKRSKIQQRILSSVILALPGLISTVGCSSKPAHDDFEDPPAQYASRDERSPGTPAGSGGGLFEGAVQAIQATALSLGNPDRYQKAMLTVLVK